MVYRPGQSGNPRGRRPKAGISTCVYQALQRDNFEPVRKLIKIIETTQDLDLKIGLLKYLIEMREGSLEKLNASGALSPEESTKDLVKELESGPSVPKKDAPAAASS